LKKYWAEKKNKMHTKLSPEVADEVKAMYERGKGVDNMALRYNAERAVAETRQGLICERWDQRFICSVSKAKSLFSRTFRKERIDNDARRNQEEEKEPDEMVETQAELEAAAEAVEAELEAAAAAAAEEDDLIEHAFFDAVIEVVDADDEI
jgi:aryl-alcohol dehydrogenase-like predicted oxidoreductase